MRRALLLLVVLLAGCGRPAPQATTSAAPRCQGATVAGREALTPTGDGPRLPGGYYLPTRWRVTTWYEAPNGDLCAVVAYLPT